MMWCDTLHKDIIFCSGQCKICKIKPKMPVTILEMVEHCTGDCKGCSVREDCEEVRKEGIHEGK